MSSVPSDPHSSPRVVLLGGFVNVVENQFPVEDYFCLAAGRDLALAATPQSVDQIIAELQAHADELGRDALLLAVAIESHAGMLRDLGRTRLAMTLYDGIRPVFERHAPPELLSNCFMNRAIVLERLGRLPEAVDEFEQAAAILRRLVEEEGRAELAGELTSALGNKAAALQRLGRLREAITEFERPVAILRRLVEDEGRAELAGELAGALGNRAFALQELGQLQEALAECERVVLIFRPLVEQAGRAELANHLARALMNKGNTLLLLGQPREALAEYEGAVAAFRRLVEEEGRADLANALARALVNKASAHRFLGQPQEAVAGYEMAIAVYRRLVEGEDRADLDREIAGAFMNKALVLEQQGELEEALTEYRRIDPSRLRGDVLRKYHDAMSNNLWQQGRRDEALEHLFRAVEVYREARRTAGLDETFLEYVAERSNFMNRVVSRALEAGRERAAFACVQEGKAGILSDLRTRLTLAPGAEPEEVRRARDNLVRWLRPSATRVSATEACPAEHAHRTREYFRTSRLASAGRGAGPGPGAGEDSRRATLEEIQAVLAPGWAVLDFWQTADEEVSAFIVCRDSFQVQTLPFPVTSGSGFHDRLTALQGLTERPLTCLQDGAASDTALDDLDTYLFAPLQPLLREKGITGLYLVPQGSLHALPLHAARRQVNGEVRYLCDDFRVAYLPSAALLPQLPKVQAGGAILSLANPDRGTAASLPFSEWEGDQLRRPGRSRWLRWLRRRPGRFHRGPEATFAATDDWTQFATLHFSCHGAGDPTFAPLSRLYLRDDLLLAHDVTCRRPALRPGALVILNGCQTGVKDQRAADEGMGLMSAFLTRGASLVLATMWSVVDGYAAEVVLSFVGELLDRGLPPVEALRVAQQRARSMTWEDYDRRCAEVGALFDPDQHPHELSKLWAQRAWVAGRCGLVGEARVSAERAAPLLRRAGMETEADRILALTRDVSARPGPAARTLPFDHPVIWGAFQLVGRVT